MAYDNYYEKKYVTISYATLNVDNIADGDVSRFQNTYRTKEKV